MKAKKLELFKASMFIGESTAASSCSIQLSVAEKANKVLNSFLEKCAIKYNPITGVQGAFWMVPVPYETEEDCKHIHILFSREPCSMFKCMDCGERIFEMHSYKTDKELDKK